MELEPAGPAIHMCANFETCDNYTDSENNYIWDDEDLKIKWNTKDAECVDSKYKGELEDPCLTDDTCYDSWLTINGTIDMRCVHYEKIHDNGTSVETGAFCQDEKLCDKYITDAADVKTRCSAVNQIVSILAIIMALSFVM